MKARSRTDNKRSLPTQSLRRSQRSLRTPRFCNRSCNKVWRMSRVSWIRLPHISLANTYDQRSFNQRHNRVSVVVDATACTYNLQRAPTIPMSILVFKCSCFAILLFPERLVALLTFNFVRVYSCLAVSYPEICSLLVPHSPVYKCPASHVGNVRKRARLIGDEQSHTALRDA